MIQSIWECVCAHVHTCICASVCVCVCVRKERVLGDRGFWYPRGVCVSSRNESVKGRLLWGMNTPNSFGGRLLIHNRETVGST